MGGCSVNREACLWQSYLHSSVLLGVRPAGIKSRRGGRRPVAGTKEFQRPGWKWILICVSTPVCHPLFPLHCCPPSTGPCSPTPFPPYFVVLPWFIKSFLKAPGLSHQQHIGQSDSLSLCRHFNSSNVAHCCPCFYSYSCCSVPEVVSVFLRICCALFLGHYGNRHQNCHTCTPFPLL